MIEFTMSQFASKEDMYKAKAEYLEEENERLQRIIDSRPAINAGLPQTYIVWSQSIYAIDIALSVCTIN